MGDNLLHELSTRVQHNCNISDARHGSDYAMCTFLMKMREYYRWEKGLPYGAPLPREDIGNWLAKREQLWADIEGQDYAPLELNKQCLDPFDAKRVNEYLAPQGLVYSAGLGRNAKPHFFLGQLERQQEPGVCSVFISNREYARDLGAPPAMTQDDIIYIRRESLRRMLWEQLESWRWNRPDNALGRAFACYDFEHDMDSSLDTMTDLEIESALLHEMGECQAGQILGEDWNRMLLSVKGTPAELMARAVRDHLADCLVTLPALAEQGIEASIHFYLGNLTHMRKHLFPAMDKTYGQWLKSRRVNGFHELAGRGRHHWQQLALRLRGMGSAEAIQKLVEANRL